LREGFFLWAIDPLSPPPPDPNPPPSAEMFLLAVLGTSRIYRCLYQVCVSPPSFPPFPHPFFFFERLGHRRCSSIPNRGGLGGGYPFFFQGVDSTIFPPRWRFFFAFFSWGFLGYLFFLARARKHPFWMTGGPPSMEAVSVLLLQEGNRFALPLFSSFQLPFLLPPYPFLLTTLTSRDYPPSISSPLSIFLPFSPFSLPLPLSPPTSSPPPPPHALLTPPLPSSLALTWPPHFLSASPTPPPSTYLPLINRLQPPTPSPHNPSSPIALAATFHPVFRFSPPRHSYPSPPHHLSFYLSSLYLTLSPITFPLLSNYIPILSYPFPSPSAFLLLPPPFTTSSPGPLFPHSPSRLLSISRNGEFFSPPPPPLASDYSLRPLSPPPFFISSLPLQLIGVPPLVRRLPFSSAPTAVLFPDLQHCFPLFLSL